MAANNTLTLSTQEDAFSFLKKLINNEISDEELPDDIEVTGTLASVLIEIDGDNYHSSVTGTLARGLWEYQQEIYRAIAHTLYGSADIRKLTKTQLQEYNIVIDVEDGCSKLIAHTKDILAYLKEGINTMESKHRLIFYVAVPLILTTGIGLTTVLYHDTTTRGRVELEQEKTAQMQVVKEAAHDVPLLQHWVDSSERGARSIVKGVPDAHSFQMGNEKINNQEITTINQRASKEIPEEYTLSGYFKITSTTEPTSTGVVRSGLSGNGDEFTASLAMSNPDTPFSDEKINEIFLAPKNGNRILLKIKIKRTSEGIKSAEILESLDKNE